MAHTIYYQNTSFPLYMILDLLDKRGVWVPVDNVKNTDLCWIGGTYKICDDVQSCFEKYIKNNCKYSIVRGDIPLYTADYLMKKSLISLADKSVLYKNLNKKYQNPDYLIKTYDVNIKNISKYKDIIDQSEYMLYLKPNEGGGREGQIKTNKYTEIVETLEKYSKFSNWQLQEFIESYTKIPSYLKVICVLVCQHGKKTVYASQKPTLSGVMSKKTGYVEQRYGKAEDMKTDICTILKDFDRKDYVGKSDFAEKIFDNSLGHGYFKKKIMVELNNISRHVFDTAEFPTPHKNEIYFHIFTLDFLIDKNLKPKFLETNIQPESYLSKNLACNDIKLIARSMGGMKKLNEYLNYEKELVDEIFSLTIDKAFKTTYKKKIVHLKKIL